MGRRSKSKRVKPMTELLRRKERFFMNYTIHTCPLCAKRSLHYDILLEEGSTRKWKIWCQNCGIEYTVELPRAMDKPDAYAKLIDHIYGGET